MINKRTARLTLKATSERNGETISCCVDGKDDDCNKTQIEHSRKIEVCLREDQESGMCKIRTDAFISRLYMYSKSDNKI